MTRLGAVALIQRFPSTDSELHIVMPVFRGGDRSAGDRNGLDATPSAFGSSAGRTMAAKQYGSIDEGASRFLGRLSQTLQ
jgi:hypothetical protein